MRKAAILAAMLVTALAVPALAGEIAPQDRKSGYTGMSAENRAMQDDDTINPATLWVLDGEALWSAKAGAANQSCAGCHGDAAVSMKGVSARYPAFDDASRAPVDIEQRINLCRTRHQNATPLPPESRDLVALSAFIGRQSRGLPIATPDDPRLKPFLARGKALYTQRQGQINLSCAQCHDDNWGRNLAGNIVPQGHPNGYPLYRLEWQSVGTLQRRLRNCLTGIRAEPYAYNAPDYVALELYLRQRAAGMLVETPAVRP
ncbi:MAG: sulfur oxidation c-type cytochrome SoxA [Rhizobiales bacterium]|nr:sulfur oxidation c-type cytochrome SoxA [Hyphomicrobiales bacterium]OJY45416.1 MAG: sulfur oxidation c-type cytochrome SoxA [Rhizobiales bacterium 64-17]